MPTNESGLVASIQKAIAERYPDVWVMKVVGGPYQMVGVPDLLVLVNGAFVGIEVKFQRPGESHEYAMSKTTAGQRVQLMKIERAGGTSGVATSVTEAIALIEQALTKHNIEREKR